ncbi:EF-hand domain-containing protein [Caballeronia sp. GAFFF1]|uniref:EF-hand domain-containing protein n=1 Tax=Caballeronia sp. GAFFF1 TaxID=2921779 RepID=UPI002028BDD9|nr:EF-hand domain-containing protein [Caballeronia sp. GAFFF1]
MSVSSVNPSPKPYQLIGGNTFGSASGLSDAAVNVTSSNSTEFSSVVTLSPDAQALMAAAAAGISIGQTNLSDLALSDSEPMAQQIPELQRATKTLPTEALQNSDAGLSQSAFNKLVARLAGAAVDVAKVFQAFDTDRDGAISNDEFEKGLANALDDPTSPFAQQLFRLINSDGNSSISSTEFTSIEAAFLQGETTLPRAAKE